MGTRSLIHVKESTLDSNTIVTIYRQYDGYPTGRGQDILNILNGGKVKITNGISGDKLPSHFNGMGELAAYLVAKEKGEEQGNVYLFPPDDSDCGEEFVYTIYVDQEQEGMVFGELDCEVMIKVNDLEMKLSEFKPEEVEEKLNDY